MRRVWIILLLLELFCAPALAQELEEELGTAALEDSLSEPIKGWMSDYSPAASIDLLHGVEDILEKGLGHSETVLRDGAETFVFLLLVIVFCKLGEALQSNWTFPVAALTGALAISLYCVRDLHSIINLGKQTMDELSVFSSVLMPVMASAAAVSGAANQAGTIYCLTVLFSNWLLQICNTLLFPMVYAYLTLALADTVLGQERLKRLRALLGWCIKTLLKALLSVFTGFLTISGALSGTADAAALKAAKFAISGMVPVVGSIISNASSTLLSSAAMLKASIGSFGVLAIFSIFLLPFLRIGVYYLTAKLSASFCGMMDSSLSGLVDAISSAMGMILAMTGSSVFLCLLSCICFLRTVNL